VLFRRKFHSYKNTIDLIKAFSLVSSSSDAELVLLSSGGHEEQKIRSKISDLGLERDVSIIVDITDELLCYFYNEATVFAFPSQAEAFGRGVYLEAMAAGLPVIHSGEGVELRL